MVMHFILASSSPRRRELLDGLGVAFDIRPAVGEEHPAPGLSGEETAAALSRAKCLEVASAAERDAVVVAADTVVCLDGAILGKPHDEADAARMLRALSGREHTVCTGVTVASGGRTLRTLLPCIIVKATVLRSSAFISPPLRLLSAPSSPPKHQRLAKMIL